MSRYVLPIMLLIGLFLTNPDRAALTKQMMSRSKNYLWTLSSYFGSNIKSLMMGKDIYYNLGVMSIVQGGSNSYHVGVAGIWIESTFWVSIPGWFLTMQFLWHLITSHQALLSRWLEFMISVWWFVILSRRIDSIFYVEKFTSLFFLLSSLLTLAIANLLFYPTKLFSKYNTHPGSLLYGTASSILVFLTMSQDKLKYGGSLRWMEHSVPLSQLCLFVLVFQIGLGHSLGFAGSVAGVVLYCLCEYGILDERNW